MELDTLRVEDIWARAEALGARTHEERTAWISYLQMALRDLLILHEDGGSTALYHTDRRDDLMVLLSRMSRAHLFDLLRETQELSHRIGANVNPALQAEAFLLRAKG